MASTLSKITYTSYIKSSTEVEICPSYPESCGFCDIICIYNADAKLQGRPESPNPDF